MYSNNRTNCGIPVNSQGAVFGVGVVANGGSNPCSSPAVMTGHAISTREVPATTV